MRATDDPRPSGGRTIVATSMISWRATIGAVAKRFSRSARTSGVHGRLVAIATSAAISARDSRVSVPLTVWIIERSATIAPTPIATQTKKKTRRRHDARISRHAINKTKVMTFASSSSDDPAIAQGDRLVRLAGELGIVRHQHHRRRAPAIDVDEQVDDLVAGAGIEVAGRLVGEQDRGLVGEGARDRHALLLASRELRRIVMAPRPEADLGQELIGADARIGLPGDLERHAHVLPRGQRGQQVKELEDEADALAAEPRELVFRQRGDVGAVA